MNVYNKIMLYFWLALAIVSTVGISYYGFTEGFDRWLYYYALPIIALLMFFFKRFMIKRMEKHLKYLEEQHRSKSEN
jgi:TRAP-type C4-dicarboxylate transport system permease small subunit